MDVRDEAEFGLIAETACFLCYFSAPPDSRQRGKVVYPGQSHLEVLASGGSRTGRIPEAAAGIVQLEGRL